MAKPVEIRVDWALEPWLREMSAEAVLAWLQLNICVAVYGRQNRVEPIDPDFLADFSHVAKSEVEEMLEAARAAGALVSDQGLWHVPDCIARRPI